MRQSTIIKCELCDVGNCSIWQYRWHLHETYRYRFNLAVVEKLQMMTHQRTSRPERPSELFLCVEHYHRLLTLVLIGMQLMRQLFCSPNGTSSSNKETWKVQKKGWPLPVQMEPPEWQERPSSTPWPPSWISHQETMTGHILKLGTSRLDSWSHFRPQPWLP